MTTAAKTWVTIIVIIILAVIGYAWYSHSSSNDMMQAGDNSQQAPMQPATDNSTSAMSSPSDSSDSGIDQDMTSINAQMSAVDSDSANANQ